MAARPSWTPLRQLETPTRVCQGTTALTSASAPRPVAAPLLWGLVRAALVDKSLKRHVTITVSGPVTGHSASDFSPLGSST
jgi:hypothetical protein